MRFIDVVILVIIGYMKDYATYCNSNHFPIQNLENMFPRRSSVSTFPVISPKLSNATLRSILSKSVGIFEIKPSLIAINEANVF